MTDTDTDRSVYGPLWSTIDALAEALNTSWTEFCADTGCHPDCITQEGKGILSADFRLGNFTAHAAAWLERDHRIVPKAIIDVIPPRLWRVLEACATVELPEGWSTEFRDAPLGMVVRRGADGFIGFLMPSTDGTPRWYNDASITGYLGGPNAGMSDNAQGAVDYVVSQAPDLATREGIEAPDE